MDEFAAGSPTPGATSTYRYDGLGRRIEKVANGQTRRYVYDGEDILLEYDGANSLLARYTHGPGIDEPLAMTRGGSAFFYHQDGLGTVTELTDNVGSTARAYAYDAYGNILDQTGTVDQPYTHTGRELDSESGLYHYRARTYDPTTGRFLQKDPLRNEIRRGRNLFAYVSGNPLRFTDPSGLQGIEDCKYYDDLCGKSRASCGLIDDYACKAGDCCREFGENSRLNCARSCLINFDHFCTKLPEQARNLCRELAHVYCYPQCDVQPQDFDPLPPSCKGIPLFGGFLGLARGRARSWRRSCFLLALVLVTLLYLGLHEFIGGFLNEYIGRTGASHMDFSNPVVLLRSILGISMLLYLPSVFWILFWLSRQNKVSLGLTNHEMATLSLLCGASMLSISILTALRVLPLDIIGGRSILLGLYGPGWCFLVVGALILIETEMFVRHLKIGLISFLTAAGWWLTDFLPFHPEVGSIGWALGYVVSFIPAFASVLHCREVRDRRFAYAGLVLLTLYMVLGRPKWLSSGTLLDFRFMTPLYFLVIAGWSVMLARSTSVLRKLNVEAS